MRISIAAILLLSTFASAATTTIAPAFEPFDATWTNRWWIKTEGGYAMKTSLDRSGLTMRCSGAGYAIIQTKSIAALGLDNLTDMPIGMRFRILSASASGTLTFEIEGNLIAKLPLKGDSKWTTVDIPFSSFSPAISFDQLRRAGFAQINVFGDVRATLGPIQWLYASKYTDDPSVDLELARFELSPNAAYNPLLKCGGAEKLIAIVDRNSSPWVRTVPNTPIKDGIDNGFSFEINGRFDEGGVPDWTQVRGVTLRAKRSSMTPSTERATLKISLFPLGNPHNAAVDPTQSIASATCTVGPDFETIGIPIDKFDRPLPASTAIGRIAMAKDVDIELTSFGAIVPEGMRRDEMKRRAQNFIRYADWRTGVFEARGLVSPTFAKAIDSLKASAKANDFANYRQQCDTIDRLYWQGIELLALRAMSDANIDRATALKDDVILEQTTAAAASVTALFDALAKGESSIDLAAVEKTQNQLADTTIAAIQAKGLRPYVKDRQFFSPSGKPIHYFGTHSFMASRKGMLLFQDIGFDLMYKRIAAMGFNGVRFEAEENQLMPEEGKLNGTTIAAYREGIVTAWKYGLWVQYDNHFYFPSWVCAGSKAFPNKVPAGQSNSYQNLDGTLTIWRATADVTKDLNNIFVYETPSNEPFFYNSNGRSILDLPSAMHAWNVFLKDKYKTREALQAAWTQNVECPEGNRLRDDERWENDSIQPLGFGETKLTDAKNQSARVWDWMEFAKSVQGRTTAAIAKDVTAIAPSATFMQQFIIGNEWDCNPIPINYDAITQVQTDKRIFIGSHYGVAGRQVLKAVALGTPSTDSENPAEDRFETCLRQKMLNSGVTLFADYARWGGGMLWENDSADFKASTAYVPLIADFYTKSEPLWTTEPTRVIVIEPTRLTATRQNDSINEIFALLDKADVPCHLFEEQYIIDHPDVLDRYDAAIVNTTMIHPAMLDALASRPIKTFLFGSPIKDAFTRIGSAGPLGWLVDHQKILKSLPTAQTAAAETTASEIRLEGNIKFRYDEKKVGMTEQWCRADLDDSDWPTKPVPGLWGELGIMGSQRYFLGDGWYRFHVTIPADWTSKEITLAIGAIDDTDEVYVNGTLAGKTTTATAGWWQVPRSYAIPNNTLCFGQSNVIAIKVTNNVDNAGIYRSPVALRTRNTTQCRFREDFGFFRTGDALTMVTSTEHVYPQLTTLRTDARALAATSAQTGVVRDGQWIFCPTILQVSALAEHEKLILSFLKDAGIDVAWPIPSKPRLYPFTQGYVIVAGAADRDARVELAGRNCRSIGMEIIRDLRQSDGKVEFTVPKGGLALIRIDAAQ